MTQNKQCTDAVRIRITISSVNLTYVFRDDKIKCELKKWIKETT